MSNTTFNVECDFLVGKVVETKKKGVLEMSTYLYDELVLAPYMAKIVVLYKPHMPHAWYCIHSFFT